MKRLAILLLFSFVGILHSQHMDNDKLELIIKKNADTLNGIPGNWKFIYKETPMLCVTDKTNNRMRIISPITSSDNLDKDLLLDAMTANFHSALDVKYAITNKILWSVYIHPLKELTEEQVNSAISQVYYAARTFGSTFSSTELIFGAGNTKKKSKEAIPEEKIRKF
ncbi:hypothetical protein [Aquimarina macrocephali]|uniref:hypothetical protein n=1 Tax=Aquimarina macrocephali TaxID=666563 RepID=UPI001F4CC7E3|nr:hypothetical protein [Aquimarina macrocephali]